MSTSPTSKQCAIWHRANAVEVPDVPEMLDHPGDTVSCFVAISDGFRVGRARWHYPTKSWCHKGSYDGNVLFWSLVPNWDRTSDETELRSLLQIAFTALRTQHNPPSDWAARTAVAIGLRKEDDPPYQMTAVETDGIDPGDPDEILLDFIGQYDQGAGDTYEFDRPTVLRMLRDAAGVNAVESTPCPECVAVRKLGLLSCHKHLLVSAAKPIASPLEPTENPERNSASQGYPQVDPRHEVSDSAAAKVGVAVVGSETIRSAKAGGDPWAEERKNCTCPKPGTSNSQIDPTCPISFPHPWARPEKTPANIGPREPDNDMVICPKCTSQFVAIPVNVQERLQRLNAINDNPVHYDTEVDQLTTRPWQGSPNDAVRWACPKCRTVNANADERCCVGSCEGRRPDPWPPITRPGRMPPWAVLLLECRDALPAISLATAKLRGIDLTLADRIEKMLEPWKVPEGKPAKYPPPNSPPRED